MARWWLRLGLGVGAFALVSSCGGSSTSTLFQGSCLAPLYACFKTEGAAECSYDSRIRVASLVYKNGAKINSDSQGSGPNRCFSPEGPICFTVTKIDDTKRNVAGKLPDGGATVNVGVEDIGDGKLRLTCPDMSTQTVTAPVPNGSFEDLRRCVQQ